MKPAGLSGVLQTAVTVLGFIRSVRSQRSCCFVAPFQPRPCLTRRFSMSTSADDTPDKPRVIVISGPTAVGKSALSLRLCKRLGGEIISVDSVQVYKKLDIGSNKPSAEERAEVPHHLIDVADADSEDVFTAGRFLDQAGRAVQDVVSRGKVPIVVGGTSMYTQWLVQGKPDAPKSDPEVEKRVKDLLRPFEQREDWEGGLALLAERHPDRAAKLLRNDWFRLERALEVSLIAGEGAKAFTGERVQKLGEYDLRCFFLVAPREPLCRVIDQRCMQMVQSGLLQETADLLVQNILNPESPPGRAIGYRQTIDYLCRPDPQMGDTKTFLEFLETFATATRRYAKTQMVWFRAQRDFMWVKWDLNPETFSGVEDKVLEAFFETRGEHEGRKTGEEQEALRNTNLEEGKKMKTYRTTQLPTPEQLGLWMSIADECTTRVQETYLPHRREKQEQEKGKEG